VLVEGRADGILDGLWDGDFEGLSVDLDEDGFDVEGVADVGLDDEGLFVWICIGNTVVDFRVVGLPDVSLVVGVVGFRVVGRVEVGLAVGVVGLFVGLLVGLCDVGLDVEGLFVGLLVGLCVGICVGLQIVVPCSLLVWLYVSSVGL
jgi:hypothetical protein